jgi:hypothetical protein
MSSPRTRICCSGRHRVEEVEDVDVEVVPGVLRLDHGAIGLELDRVDEQGEGAVVQAHHRLALADRMAGEVQEAGFRKGLVDRPHPLHVDGVGRALLHRHHGSIFATSSW